MTATPVEDLEDLYEHAPCGYLSLNGDGRIAKVNQTLTGWIGYAVDELLRRRFSELLNIAGRIYYETHFAPLMRMQGFFNEVALDITTKAGAQLPVIANAVERRDPAGNLLFTRITILKATDRRRYERELLSARVTSEGKAQRLEQHLLDERAAAELREQFIAVLGHDLRNPLAAIGTGAALLAGESLSERGQRAVALTKGSVARMSSLIDNVLDLARGRLGGGLTVAVAENAQLGPLLRQVIGEVEASCAECSFDVAIDVTHVVVCDPTRIGQLLSNLLGNAVTHGSRDAPISVRVTTNGANLEISVTNGGEPIAEAAREHLFQPFFRGSVRPSKQGLGLGLYIASEIAKAHQGTISVVSTREATSFTFVMPLGLSAS